MGRPPPHRSLGRDGKNALGMRRVQSKSQTTLAVGGDARRFRGYGHRSVRQIGPPPASASRYPVGRKRRRNRKQPRVETHRHRSFRSFAGRIQGPGVRPLLRLRRHVRLVGEVDLFTLAGLPQPDISILSPEFLAEVRALPQKNVAVELLRRLLEDEIRSRRRRNLIQSRSFSAMLQETLARYNQQSIAATDIIEELITLAEEIREAQQRGEDLGLSDEELAFYDALETNDSAVAVLGDEKLRAIAQELVKTVRGNISIDWELRESARADMRRLVKRILRRYGYPPDKQESATRTVIQQAELLSQGWVGAA